MPARRCGTAAPTVGRDARAARWRRSASTSAPVALPGRRWRSRRRATCASAAFLASRQALSVNALPGGRRHALCQAASVSRALASPAAAASASGPCNAMSACVDAGLRAGRDADAHPRHVAGGAGVRAARAPRPACSPAVASSARACAGVAASSRRSSDSDSVSPGARRPGAPGRGSSRAAAAAPRARRSSARLAAATAARRGVGRRPGAAQPASAGQRDAERARQPCTSAAQVDAAAALRAAAAHETRRSFAEQPHRSFEARPA